MTNRQDELRITRVDSIGGDALDIALSNGNIILLQTALILALPGFGHLAVDDRVLYPKTDGASILWQDGPRKIPLAELQELSFKGSQKEDK